MNYVDKTQHGNSIRNIGYILDLLDNPAIFIYSDEFWIKLMSSMDF